jgi:hypothetical protein
VVPEHLEDVKRSVAAARKVPRVTCRRVRRLMSAYLDDLVPPVCLAPFEAHLFTCAACYRQYRSLLDVCSAVSALKAEGPPEGLRERIRASVAAECEARKRPQVSWRWAWAASAVSVVLLVGMAVLVWHAAPTGREPRAVTGERVAIAPPAPANVFQPSAPLRHAPPVGVGMSEGGRPNLAAKDMPRAKRGATPTLRNMAAAIPPSTRALDRPKPALVIATAPTESRAESQPIAVETRPVPELEELSTSAPTALPIAESRAGGEVMGRPAEKLPADSSGRTTLATEPRTERTEKESPASAAVASETVRPAPPASGVVERAEPEQVVRLADAGVQWLPVRRAEPERVIVAATSPTEVRLEEAARRLNDHIRTDERSSGDGWISIK